MKFFEVEICRISCVWTQLFSFKRVLDHFYSLTKYFASPTGILNVTDCITCFLYLSFLCKIVCVDKNYNSSILTIYL